MDFTRKSGTQNGTPFGTRESSALPEMTSGIESTAGAPPAIPAPRPAGRAPGRQNDVPLPLPRTVAASLAPKMEALLRSRTPPLRTEPPRNPYLRERPAPTPQEIAIAVMQANHKRRTFDRSTGRRRLFVPNNAALYNAAYIGFISGCNQARTIGSSTTGLLGQAVFFAQAVDTGILFDAALTQSKIDLLTEIVSNVFGELYPQGLLETDYLPTAQQVIALYNEAILLLAPTPPPGGGIPTDIVFRQGGVTAGNVYATDVEVAAAIAAANGACTVWIDGSIAPCTLSVVWDLLFRATIKASLAGSANSLEILDGGQIRNTIGPCFLGVQVQCDCQTLPSFGWDSWAGTNFIQFDEGSSLNLSSTCTISPIQVPADAKGFALGLLLALLVNVDNSDAPTVPVISLGTNALLIVVMVQGQPGNITTGLFSGDGTTAYAWFADASGFPIPAFTSASVFAGEVMLDQAVGVAYSPTTPGDWSPAPSVVGPALDQLAARSSGGSGYVVWTQDISAGGTIAYTGPSGAQPIADMIILTGAPAGAVTFTMPTQPFASTFVNRSGAIVGFVNAVGGVNLSATADYVAALIGYVDAGVLSIELANGNNIAPSGGGDIGDYFNSGGRIQFIGGMGALNKEVAGLIGNIPIYGTLLSPQDATFYGVTPPTIGTGPGASDSQFVTYTTGQGWYFYDGDSGCYTLMGASAGYNIFGWSTQAQIYGATSNTAFGSPFGDTVVGPSASSTVTQSLYGGTFGSGGCSSIHGRLVVQCRVVSTSGLTETVGDMITFTQDVDYAQIAGTAQCMPGTQTQQSYSSVSGINAGTISLVTFTPSASGASAQLEVTTPIGFDPSTVLDIQYSTDGLPATC